MRQAQVVAVHAMSILLCTLHPALGQGQGVRQEKVQLRLLLMFMEEPIAREDVAGRREEFVAEYEGMLTGHALRALEAAADEEYLRFLLGQTGTLSLLTAYSEVQGIRLKVDFAFWEHAQGAIERGVKAGQHNRIHLFQVGSTWIPHFVAEGYFHALDVSKLKEENYPPACWRSCTNGQKLYAVPAFLDLRLLYSRKQWSRAAAAGGRSYEPIDGAEKSDWEDFERQLRSWKKAVPQARPFVLPLSHSWELSHQIAPWVWGAGGRYVEEVTIPFPLPRWLGGPYWRVRLGRSEAWRNTIHFLDRLSREQLLSVAYPDATHALRGMEEKFLDYKFVSFVSNYSFMSRLAAEAKERADGRPWTDHVAVAIPPGIREQERTTYIGGAHFCIHRDVREEELEAALKLATWLAEWPVHVPKLSDPPIRSRLSNLLPADRDARRAFFEAHPDVYPPDVRKTIDTAIGCALSYPAIPEWAVEVERDTVLVDLYSLFAGLGQGPPRNDHLTDRLGEAGQELQRRLNRGKLHPGLLLLLAVLTACFALWWFRWRVALAWPVSTAFRLWRTQPGTVGDRPRSLRHRHLIRRIATAGQTGERASACDLEFEEIHKRGNTYVYKAILRTVGGETVDGWHIYKCLSRNVKFRQVRGYWELARHGLQPHIIPIVAAASCGDNAVLSMFDAGVFVGGQCRMLRDRLESDSICKAVDLLKEVHKCHPSKKAATLPYRIRGQCRADQAYRISGVRPAEVGRRARGRWAQEFERDFSKLWKTVFRGGGYGPIGLSLYDANLWNFLVVGDDVRFIDYDRVCRDGHRLFDYAKLLVEIARRLRAQEACLDGHRLFADAKLSDYIKRLEERVPGPPAQDGQDVCASPAFLKHVICYCAYSVRWVADIQEKGKRERQKELLGKLPGQLAKHLDGGNGSEYTDLWQKHREAFSTVLGLLDSDWFC